MQEGEERIVDISLILLGAALAQAPGVLCGELHRQISSRNTSIFLAPAFCIAASSLLVYTYCIAAGQAEPVEYSAQLHLFRIPLVLVIVAFIAYFITGIIWAGIKLTQRGA